MPSISLKDFCFSKEASLDSEFVGIHFNEGKFEIVFPLGFTPSANDEKSLRKEILLLIKILRSYKNNDRQKSTEKEISSDFKDFPLSSYLFVFNYFLKNGYYRTSETLYAKNAKGKSTGTAQSSRQILQLAMAMSSTWTALHERQTTTTKS